MWHVDLYAMVCEPVVTRAIVCMVLGKQWQAKLMTHSEREESKCVIGKIMPITTVLLFFSLSS